MYQPISTLNLPEAEIFNILKQVSYVDDIESDVLQNIQGPSKVLSLKSASEIYEKESNLHRVSTCVETLDSALRGGLKNGQITEFCGHSGSGKTYLCLQMCANILISQHKKQDFQTCIFVSTNNNFVKSRFIDILNKMILQQMQSAYCDITAQTIIENVLERILLVTIDEFAECVSFLNYLETKICKTNQVAIVIIDNIFNLFKPVDGPERTQYIYKLLMDLQKLSNEYRFPIVFTNNLTIRKANNCNQDPNIPALGDTYYHRINNRILLSIDEYGQHTAKIIKSATAPNMIAKFVIK